jgi:alkylhydroperoxidase family enzyme
MPRIQQVSRSDLHPAAETIFQLIFGDRDPTVEPGTDTGSPGDWWPTFALVPEVFDHAVAGLALYRSSERELDPQLRELGQTRVGWDVGSRFVFSQHCKSCRTVGISEEKIRSIPNWEESECFNEIERAVLAYTDCLAINNGLVADEIFQTLTEHLSDEEILELTYIVATYGMHGIISRALRLEFDSDESQPLEEVEGDHQSLSKEHTEKRMEEIFNGEKSGD